MDAAIPCRLAGRVSRMAMLIFRRPLGCFVGEVGFSRSLAHPFGQPVPARAVSPAPIVIIEILRGTPRLPGLFPQRVHVSGGERYLLAHFTNPHFGQRPSAILRPQCGQCPLDLVIAFFYRTVATESREALPTMGRGRRDSSMIVPPHGFAEICEYYSLPSRDEAGHVTVAWQAANLVLIPSPFPLTLAWAPHQVVSHIRCHKKIVEPLTAALRAVKDAGLAEYLGKD